MATKTQGAKKRPQPVKPPVKSSSQASFVAVAPQLRRLHIQNYKALDDLVLEIPAPRMAGDPDILVLGSKNGVGKTSVLEAIALAVFAAQWGLSHRMPVEIPTFLTGIMVRAGERRAAVRAAYGPPGGTAEIEFFIHRDFSFMYLEGKPVDSVHAGRFATVPGVADIPFPVLLEHASDPILAPPLLYFHSHRKVLEGSVEIGDILGGSASPSSHERRPSSVEPPRRTTSAFKIEILRALMKRAGLFEDSAATSNGDDLEQLNKLMLKFAAGAIEKLRPSRDNSIDLRVSPSGGGASYSFDGLSSGQKEIISTLFLIWKHTRKRPSIVLIDEPELHLNAEWHRTFVRALCDLSPDNQYILATHSEDVFGSVDEDRRVLLSRSSTAAAR